MNRSAEPDEIAAAKAYEELYVPALFRQWAPRLCDAAAISRGDRVLDVACGTGVLAREAAGRVGDDGSVVGLDPGAGMLAVAAELAPDLEWREGVAESLPYEDASFDAVLSQFGLMFFPDRAATIGEMLRVVAPGGRLSVSVWESLERSEAYPEAVDLLRRLAGTEAADALRAPFVLGDRGELQSMFEEAGAAAIEIVTQKGAAVFPSVRTMVEADLRGWLPVMGVPLPEAKIEEILAEAEQVLAGYVTERGTMEFEAPAHIVTVRKAS
jgi:ubiquinone/menaquinone biosynthesis C-methylase UbiE